MPGNGGHAWSGRPDPDPRRRNPPVTHSFAILVAICILSVAGLLQAEAGNWRAGKLASKLLASTAFVLLAVSVGPCDTTYGRLVLLALVLSWLGDALLLSRRPQMFLSGLLAFLCAHLAFSAAFAATGFERRVAVFAFLALALCGVLIMRWLWRHLTPTFRLAVTGYVLAIVVMCSLAVSASAATGTWIYAVGASAFAASDLSVARDRFVASGLVNRIWGLPLYYVAQLLLAWSITFESIVAG